MTAEFVPGARLDEMNDARRQRHDPNIILQMIRERQHLPLRDIDFAETQDEWMTDDEWTASEEERAELRRKHRIVVAIINVQNERIRQAERLFFWRR